MVRNQITRRTVMRGTSLGAIAIAAFGSAVFAPSRVEASEYQSNWRWCRRCMAMFYGGVPGSVCVLGGAHDATGSGNYILGTSPTAPGQENWRWCRQCQGLFYAGAGTFGRCAAGPGGHTNAGSGNYRLTSGPSALGQHGWRWCRRCQSMFFSNATAASCADGGLHDGTASGDYVIASID